MAIEDSPDTATERARTLPMRVLGFATLKTRHSIIAVFLLVATALLTAWKSLVVWAPFRERLGIANRGTIVSHA